MAPAKSSDLLTEDEFCAESKTTQRTAQRWRSTGEGPKWVRLGKRQIRYRREDVDDWYRENTFASRAAEIQKAA